MANVVVVALLFSEQRRLFGTRLMALTSKEHLFLGVSCQDNYVEGPQLALRSCYPD